MSNLLKDIYSKSFYKNFSEVLSHTIVDFDELKFHNLIFNDEFTGYELKERMTHTTKVLNYFLPDNFEKAMETIKHIIENLRIAGIKEESVEFMFFPEYIALYGIDDYRTSVSAFEFITQFTSCEFAVRPFILEYEDKMLNQMLLWSKHKSHMVRRLASEGSRPRLPWAMALPNLKKNPFPLLPILNNLKLDDSETVRRSVANNLNDISKDNPEFVIKVVKEWRKENPKTYAMTKHACRTLLKQGHPEVLKLFGFDSQHIELINFEITTPKVKLGDSLEFLFSIFNSNKNRKMVRLEYGVYYKKSNGSFARKVFKISEREIQSSQTFKIKRKQSFRPITTRKYYTGNHQLSIIINGRESEIKSFEVIN